MSSEVLRSACQLAFAVARDGSEANDPIDPPAAMRSFLYVEDLPRRALAAAQQVIEENSEFRHRVAMRANEDEVGRAGFLWLHRPTGWAQEFEALALDADDGWASLESSDPDPMLEAVYKGLTAEPIEIVPAQPPEPDDTLEHDADPPEHGEGEEGDDQELGGPANNGAEHDDPADADDNPADSDSDDSLADDGAADDGDADDGAADDGAADDSAADDGHADDGASIEPSTSADTPMATVSLIGMADLEPSTTGEHLPVNRPSGTERFPPSSASLGLAAVTNTEHSPMDPEGFEMASAGHPPADGDDTGFEADALESELASLRGLVARLASERDAEPTERLEIVEDDADVVEDDEHEDEILELASPGNAAVEDPGGLAADLDAAHHELYLTRADLTIARQEREEAQRLQSEALKRQVQLEKELATVRERKADLEGDLTSSQAKAISVEERFGRIEAQLAEVDREREIVRGQLETMTLERNQIRDERAALRAERDELKARLDDIVQTTGGADIVELVEDHKVARSELANTSRELARMIAQAEQYDEQVKTLTADTTALKSERIDLRSRLGETETALEATTTQYEALKIDAERIASELGALRAERDGLQTQLGDLQVSLGEVLDEQAEGRQRNDADRRLLNELRVEHDVLLSRLSDVEQSEQDARNRVNLLSTEREELLVGRDELLEERGQLRGEVATASAERGAAQDRLAEVENKLPPLENELQMERRQREELANRLLELDDRAERTEAERLGLIEERDTLASGVERLEAERADAEQFRRERDELATELAAARATQDGEIQALQGRIDEAAHDAEQLTEARSAVEQQVADLGDEIQALRSQLVDVEGERDQARAGEAEAVEVRAELEAREVELEDVKAELDAFRRDVDEAKVAAQVKESELRTVLGARTADAAEIERLKTNLAESMVRADSEVQDQANALAAREADLEARDDELASLRTELEAVRSVMADAEDENLAELATVRAELTEATDGADQLRAELAEAATESDRLQAELAEVRVELASAAAELEGHAAAGIPVADGPVRSDSFTQYPADDELDSTAAEVRSALRGPSVLDSIADGLAGSTPTSLRPDDLDPAGDEIEETSSADQTDEVEPIEAVPTSLLGGGPSKPSLLEADDDSTVDDEVEDEDKLDADADAEVGPDADAEVDADSELDADADIEMEAVLTAGAATGFDEDSNELVDQAEPADSIADDELDEVSELIARKMSTFTPDDLTSVGTPTDENLDLAAELALAPADPSVLDREVNETVGVSSTPPSILGDSSDSFRPAERPDLGVSRSGGPKRRRIEVPGDIIDDEVAAARYVVSSPDVVLLVDGDSVAQMGWPKLPVAQQRDALVTYLADLSANSGAAPDVVFDGRIGDGDSLPASRAVRIRLSTPPTPPTAALDELVDAYPEQWPIALVTDNSDLAATAGERGAAVLNNGQLLDLFIAE